MDGQNHHARWSVEEDTKLQRMWLRDGKTQVDIANELEKSKSAITRRIDTLGLKGHKGDLSFFGELQGEANNPLLHPIRIELPEREKSDFDSADFVSLHWSDVHYPFEDPRAVEILYKVAELVKPSELYCHGDVYDFYQLSQFRPPEEKTLEPDQIDLQSTIEAGTKHLGQMMDIAVAEKAVFFAGNHEDRYAKMLLGMQRDPRYRYLMQLTSVQDALTLEKIAGIEDLGYDYVPYVGGGSYLVHDRLVLMHGYSATKWVTRGELERYGKSVIFGHTHRIQNFTKRDLRSTDSAWSMGCLCDLDQFYTRQADWAQGFAVVTWKRMNGGYLFNVEQVRIHDGQAVWRDHILKA